MLLIAALTPLIAFPLAVRFLAWQSEGADSKVVAWIILFLFAIALAGFSYVVLTVETITPQPEVLKIMAVVIPTLMLSILSWDSIRVLRGERLRVSWYGN